MSRIFFDIETLADPASAAILPDPPLPYGLADPAKIKLFLEEKRADQVKKAALDPDAATVLAISYVISPFEPPHVDIVGDPEFPDEFSLIHLFWEHFAQCRGYAVGYNILAFDLPFLLRRSFALGISIPLVPCLANYRSEPITDLYQLLYNWSPGRGLKWVARRYGLPVRAPGLDGSAVASMDRDTLRQYAASDVELVVQLYTRMKGIYFP